MPKKGKGIILKDFFTTDNAYYSSVNEEERRDNRGYHYRGHNHHGSSSRTTGDGGGPAHFRPPPHHASIDAITLRQIFMLQNFQFIIRADLFDYYKGTLQSMRKATAATSLPQGIRRLVECLRDGDLMIPWEAVHSVVAHMTFEDYQCPICLDPPTAPRITECGHLFCLPCALHYLDEQRRHDKPRNCPVCHSTMHRKALRPCVFKPVEVLRAGQLARFDLFLRERHSCLLRRYDDPAAAALSLEHGRLSAATPAAAACAQQTATVEQEVNLPRCGAPYATQSRYVISTAEFEVQTRLLDGSSISEQLHGLEQQARPLSEADAVTERYLLEALNEITKDPQELAASLVRSSPPLAPRDPPARQKVSLLDLSNGDASAQRLRQDQPTNLFEIYMEGEGRPYFLHMLCMKMLRHDAQLRARRLVDGDGEPAGRQNSHIAAAGAAMAAAAEVAAERAVGGTPGVADAKSSGSHFTLTDTNTNHATAPGGHHHRGSAAALASQPPPLEQLPETITAPIDEIVTFTQSEESKKIYKVFSNVPLHGTVRLCLLDLSEVVLPETMAAFKDTLREIAEDRARRQRKEDSQQQQSLDEMWRQYLEKYNTSPSPSTVTSRTADLLTPDGRQLRQDQSPSGASHYYEDEKGNLYYVAADGEEGDRESLPYLELPSVGSAYEDHGLGPNTLETRQRATKRGENLLEGAVASPTTEDAVHHVHFTTTSTTNNATTTPQLNTATLGQLLRSQQQQQQQQQQQPHHADPFSASLPSSPNNKAPSVTSSSCWTTGSARKLFKK